MQVGLRLRAEPKRSINRHCTTLCTGLDVHECAVDEDYADRAFRQDPIVQMGPLSAMRQVP